MKVIYLWFIMNFMIRSSDGSLECQNALGMENGAIADGQITASSVHSPGHESFLARLYFQGKVNVAGGWAVNHTSDANPWLQVDLGDTYTKVTGIATQGRGDCCPQWVTKYKLQYGEDGVTFQYYLDEQGQPKDFDGNWDQNTVHRHDLNPPIRARYIRLLPLSWNEHATIRMELYGCTQGCQQPLGMANGAISDEQLSASSEWEGMPVNLSRLHLKLSWGSWVAATNDTNQWIQIDLIGQHTKVIRVATQGRSTYCCQWVTKYNLLYGNNGVNFQYYKEQGQTVTKEFAGNSNQDEVVTHELNPPIWARYIRFRPLLWYGHVSMRVEVYGCTQECQEALGVQSGLISDKQLSASSEWDAEHGAHKARLHKTGWPGSWSAGTNDANQWLQIDVLGLGKKYTKLTRIATQGRGSAHPDAQQWVTKYKLQFSDDGVNFQYYKEEGQTTDKEFAGNIDNDTVVHHELNPPIRARYIRFRPLTWYGHVSMRVEIYGCTQECTTPAVGMETGKILDYQITASSEISPASLGRLNGRFAWCPLTEVNEYIQIDLARLYRVCGVATQGNPKVTKDYLKEYKLAWSNDNNTWETSAEILAGNSNWRDVIKNSIPVIYARYIRLVPLKWHIRPCTRMEIYGEPWPEGPSALFTPIGLGKVTGHVISSKNVTHVTDCMKLCMVTEQCNSFSFNERLKNCQVSGSTAEVQSLENQDGFNYYERAAFPVMTP